MLATASTAANPPCCPIACAWPADAQELWSAREGLMANLAPATWRERGAREKPGPPDALFEGWCLQPCISRLDARTLNWSESHACGGSATIWSPLCRRGDPGVRTSALKNSTALPRCSCPTAGSPWLRLVQPWPHTRRPRGPTAPVRPARPPATAPFGVSTTERQAGQDLASRNLRNQPTTAILEPTVMGTD